MFQSFMVLRNSAEIGAHELWVHFWVPNSKKATGRDSARWTGLRRTAIRGAPFAARLPFVFRTRQDLDQPEPLAKQLHVGPKSAIALEIGTMTLSPPGQRPRPLAFIERETFIDFIEATDRDLDGFDHRRSPAPAVQHDITSADLRTHDTAFGKVAQRAAGGRLRAGQHQSKQLVRHFRAIAKGKCDGGGIGVGVTWHNCLVRLSSEWLRLWLLSSVPVGQARELFAALPPIMLQLHYMLTRGSRGAVRLRISPMIERRSFLKAAALGAATAGLGSFARGEAKSVEPTSTPPFYRFKVGDFTLTPLCDGMFQLPTDSIGTNAEPSERKAYFEAHYLTGDAFPLQLTPLLIDTGDKLVLIDSGMGPGQESWAPGANKLAGSLKAAGIAGEDIDVIVLTHGHIDHVGGLEAGATKQYANAEVVLSAIELDLWRAPDAAKKVPEWAAGGVPALQQTFTALGDRLRTTKEGEDIVPGIATVSSPGHTPGHISLLVSSGKDALFVTGDAVASIHIALDHPEWQMVWDHDRELGAKTRQNLLDRLSHDRLLVAGGHFPFPGIGHVVKEGNDYGWLPVNWVFETAT